MLTMKTSKLRTLLALSMCTCLYHYEDCNGPGPSARLIGLKSTSPFSHAVLSNTSLSKISKLYVMSWMGTCISKLCLG